MKARRAHPQGVTPTTPQQAISTEHMCSLVRQAQFCIRTARALVRRTQPAIQHLHILLRNHELSQHEPMQLGKETERLASVTQQLTTLTHAFSNTLQKFVLEVTLQQPEEQPPLVSSSPQLAPATGSCEETF